MMNVVLIGRPNVGKSTLFNALVGRRVAIEGDLPGTTRDMRIGEMNLPKLKKDGVIIKCIDTPGFDAFDIETNEFSKFLQKVVQKGIDLADIILFVVDRNSGILPQDKQIADLIRRSGKEVILVVNKIDGLSNKGGVNDIWNFSEFGISKMIGASAVHRKGIDDLKKMISKMYDEFERLDSVETTLYEVRPPVISLIGRPNVGKSSLFNAILGEERMIVSDIAGTTRDNADSELILGENKYIFIDTAGIRKSGKLREKPIERLSITQTVDNIERSDICLLLLDSSRPIESEDLVATKEITRLKKACIIVVTKWDKENSLLKGDLQKIMDSEVKKIQKKFPYLYWAPVIFTSSKTNLNINKLFSLIDHVYSESRKKIDTSTLNKWLKMVLAQKQPTGTKSIAPKINFASQVGILPPKFVFFINKENSVHFSYQRYLENRLRDDFGFMGVNLDFEFTVKKKKDYTA